jgi:hypothetical protein
MVDLKSKNSFWKTLEKKPVLLNPEAYQKILTKRLSLIPKLERKMTIKPAEEPSSSKLPNYLELWKIERLEDMIRRIKEANIEYIKNLKIIVRNRTKTELRKAVIDIQEQFQLEVFTMKKEHNLMKEEITAKNRLIFEYGQYNLEQNSAIFLNSMNEPDFVSIPEDKTRDEINSLKETLAVFRSQVDAIKEVAAEYGKEAEAAIRKVKEVDLEIQKIKNQHALAMQMLRQAIGSQEEEILMEKKKIFEEFNAFRNKITQELEIRNLLDLRQKEFIVSLQSEIKDAKIILQNPRMRLRVHEKLKETAEEEKNLLPVIGSKDKSLEYRTQSAGKGKNEIGTLEFQRAVLHSQGSPRSGITTAKHGRNSSFLFK